MHLGLGLSGESVSARNASQVCCAVWLATLIQSVYSIITCRVCRERGGEERGEGMVGEGRGEGRRREGRGREEGEEGRGGEGRGGEGRGEGRR